MKLEWKQVIPALLIGCIVGLLAGSGLHHAVAFWRIRHGGPSTEQLLEKFTKALKLDARQEEGVRAVLETYRGKTQSLHQELSSRFKDIRTSMRADIEKLLTPEQQKRFQEMQSRWDSHHRNWEAAPRPFP